MYLLQKQIMIPIIKGITEIQRKGKKALEELITQKSNIIYLASRNKIFAVVMSIEEYEKLSDKNETWLKATEKSLDFWNDPSNDIYEQLLKQ